MIKVGRNDPCPCGSGKKFKACCAANMAHRPVQPSPSESVAECMRMAWHCFQTGQFGEADMLARSILEVQPRHAEALHLCSAVCLENGDPGQAIVLIDKAIAASPLRPEFHLCLGSALALAGRAEAALQSLRRAVQLKPDFAAGHNRLGALLQEQGKPEEAVASFKRAAKCAPGFAPFLSNLGIAYLQLKDEVQALAAFEDALKADPQFVGALANMGILLKSLGRNDEAIRHFERVLAIHPDHTQTLAALGNLHRQQGRIADAVAHFERALQADPHNADLRFQLDTLKRNNVERPPLEYVRNLFDGFADRFEQELVDKLAYTAPRLLADAINGVAGGKSDWRALDLGCGTGLMGVALKPVAAGLTGVDASPGMLAKASERGIYDALAQGDLIEFLQGSSAGSFDLLCAADVFIYIGNLAPVFAAAERLLPPGSLFAFSLEANLTDDQPFLLGLTSRYAHSRAGIESLGGQYGFSVAHFSACTLRTEKEAPVAGYLFVLRKA